MNLQIEDIKQRILKADSIIITSHVSPDGDAIGSTLGLYHYLKNFNKSVKVIVPNDFPSFLAWLPKSCEIMIYEKNEAQAKEAIAAASLLFCLDFNETSRTAFMKAALDDSKAFKVLIDHHIGSPTWPDVNLSVVGASSTCELVFDFIEVCSEHKIQWTSEIAVCLYTGLLTDTGNFQFSATTPKVHYQAAKLIEAGVEPDAVHNHINNSFDIDRLKFFGYCISEKMKIVKDKKLAYIFVSSSEMQRYNIQTGGTEGLVNEAMKIQGVDVSVLFKEDRDKIKISFRSKRAIDVSAFSNQFYNGGGHRNAAGGVSFKSMKETEEEFLERLSYLKL